MSWMDYIYVSDTVSPLRARHVMPQRMWMRFATKKTVNIWSLIADSKRFLMAKPFGAIVITTADVIVVVVVFWPTDSTKHLFRKYVLMSLTAFDLLPFAFRPFVVYSSIKFIVSNHSQIVTLTSHIHSRLTSHALVAASVRCLFAQDFGAPGFNVCILYAGHKQR